MLVKVSTCADLYVKSWTSKTEKSNLFQNFFSAFTKDGVERLKFISCVLVSHEVEMVAS